jgi:hypothetical protein
LSSAEDLKERRNIRISGLNESPILGDDTSAYELREKLIVNPSRHPVEKVQITFLEQRLGAKDPRTEYANAEIAKDFLSWINSADHYDPTRTIQITDPFRHQLSCAIAIFNARQIADPVALQQELRAVLPLASLTVEMMTYDFFTRVAARLEANLTSSASDKRIGGVYFRKVSFASFVDDLHFSSDQTTLSNSRALPGHDISLQLGRIDKDAKKYPLLYKIGLGVSIERQVDPEESKDERVVYLNLFREGHLKMIGEYILQPASLPGELGFFGSEAGRNFANHFLEQLQIRKEFLYEEVRWERSSHPHQTFALVAALDELIIVARQMLEG